MGNIVNIKPDPLCKLLFDRRLASEYIKVVRLILSGYELIICCKFYISMMNGKEYFRYFQVK